MNGNAPSPTCSHISRQTSLDPARAISTSWLSKRRRALCWDSGHNPHLRMLVTSTWLSAGRWIVARPGHHHKSSMVRNPTTRPGRGWPVGVFQLSRLICSRMADIASISFTTRMSTSMMPAKTPPGSFVAASPMTTVLPGAAPPAIFQLRRAPSAIPIPPCPPTGSSTRLSSSHPRTTCWRPLRAGRAIPGIRRSSST